MTTRMEMNFEEAADAKVQLEQAISEAREQHRRLRDQAASVIANQKQTEMRISRSLEDLERVNTNARRALMMAEKAAESGDEVKLASYTAAAEQFAGRLITLEGEIDSLKELHFQASIAADQAKAAVEQNSRSLQQKLNDRQKLLSQLDQARMQEQMNSAMNTLSESVGDDVPTFNEVRDKIEARYAKAKGVAELTDTGGTEAAMLEIEAAARADDAKARLSQIREQLGLPAGDSGATELGAAQPAADTPAVPKPAVPKPPGAPSPDS